MPAHVYSVPHDGYAREVEGVDPSHLNGWCIAGPFIKRAKGATVVSSEARVVLVVDRASGDAHVFLDGEERETARLGRPGEWQRIATYILGATDVPRVTVVVPAGGKRRRNGGANRSGETWTRDDSGAEVVAFQEASDDPTIGELAAAEALAQVPRDLWGCVLALADEMRTKALHDANQTT